MCSQGNRITEKYNGEQPQSSCFDPTTVPQECVSWDNASHEESQHFKRVSRESNGSNRSNTKCNDGVQRFQMPKPTEDTGTTEPQVSDIVLQTDSCDTIVVVQNTQSLQFEQMQIAVQMAQNQASIETLLRSEQFMNAHFNLAVLTDEHGYNKEVNAKTSKIAAVDTGPTTSTAEQETYIKTLCRNNSGRKGTKWPQPTGTIPSTCRGDFDYINGIPSGYASDNSCVCNSTIVKLDNIHNHDIVPLVACRVWTAHPSRGRGQNYRQNNNITVRDGNGPHSRPWQ